MWRASCWTRRFPGALRARWSGSAISALVLFIEDHLLDPGDAGAYPLLTRKRGEGALVAVAVRRLRFGRQEAAKVDVSAAAGGRVVEGGFLFSGGSGLHALQRVGHLDVKFRHLRLVVPDAAVAGIVVAPEVRDGLVILPEVEPGTGCCHGNQGEVRGG